MLGFANPGDVGGEVRGEESMVFVGSGRSVVVGSWIDAGLRSESAGRAFVCGTLHQYHYWFDSNSDYGYTYFLKSEQLIARCRRRERHVCGSSHARLGHRWYTGMDRSEVRFFSSSFHYFIKSSLHSNVYHAAPLQN